MDKYERILAKLEKSKVQVLEHGIDIDNDCIVYVIDTPEMEATLAFKISGSTKRRAETSDLLCALRLLASKQDKQKE